MVRQSFSGLFLAAASCLLASCATSTSPDGGALRPDPSSAAGSSPESSADEFPAPPAGGEWSFLDLLAEAFRRSPALLAMTAESDAAGAAADQARLWPNPTLRLEARDLPRSALSLSRGEEWAVLMQPVSFSGRRGAEIDAADATLRAQRLRLEAERRDVFERVGAAWAEALYDQERQAPTKRLAEIASRRAELAASRVRSGSAPPDSTVSSVVASEAARLAAFRAERELASHLAAVEALVGGGPILRIVPESRRIPPLPDLGEVRRRAFRANPRIEAARAEQEAAQARVRAAQQGRVPDPDLMLAVGRARSEDESFVEIGVSFPLPVWDLSNAKIRGAEAMAARAEALLLKEESELRAAVAADMARVRTANEELASQRDRVVPALAAAHARLAESFARGTRTEDEVLEAERSLVEARLSLLLAERDARIADVSIRRHLLGTTPGDETAATDDRVTVPGAEVSR